jgi:hypothetical protein
MSDLVGRTATEDMASWYIWWDSLPDEDREEIDEYLNQN